MRLILLGLALMFGDVIAQGFVRSPSAPLLPATSFASFHRRPVSSAVVRQSTLRQRPFRANAGSCDSCGPNTYCETGRDDRIYCRCKEGFVAKENTIKGCEYQCTRDSDCDSEYQCKSNKCEKVCSAGACGINAECFARSHQAKCECPAGYDGVPESRCSKIIPETPVVRDLPVDLCYPNPCGDNADCVERGDRPVCSCPLGYEGDPLVRCIRGECIEHNDCPDNQACSQLRCFDPCPGTCGAGALCNVKNHQPVCSCPEGHIGDPFVRCRRITEADVCNPTPCGRNTDCRGETRQGQLRAICSCSGNKIGDPLTGCHAECTRGSDCPSHQTCRDERCRNACYKGVCGENSICDVVRNEAVCSCPQYAKGDPYTRCDYDCTEHSDCPNHQACLQFECIDPCEGACGTGANCRVKDHSPICSCPKGYTGHPYESCRPFTLADLCADEPCGTNAICTPGKDRDNNDRPVCTCPHGYLGNPLIRCEPGECTTDSQCGRDEVCYGFNCQSPCFYEKGSVCGENARCTVRNRQPVCSCPQGYEGDPRESCNIAPNARVAGTSVSAQRRLSGGVRFVSPGSSRYYK